MLAYQVVVDEKLVAAFDQRSHAEQWGSCRSDPDEVCAVARPDLQRLTYRVFDGGRLVAAFAMRDDAEHWIEECGNHAMKLRQMNTRAVPVQSGKGRTHRIRDKAGGPVPRRR
jgi:hypothetical protein